MSGPKDPDRQVSAAPSVIAPGNYDGVHLGHRALIARARELAGQRNARTCVLTFDPHPASVLAPDHAPPLLTTLERRQELLLAMGADAALVQPFDRGFSNNSPESFYTTLRARGAVGLVVGPDFRFGKDRKGDVTLLAELGAPDSVAVHVEPPVLHDGERVSSSAVRQALIAGDVSRAASLLQRLHDVSGLVVEGHKRGRTLGFPTANLDCDRVLMPADGVYAVMVRVLDTTLDLLPGVANLGTRPTFEAGRSVEVHLLDQDLELYGKRLRVGFGAAIRPERRFGSEQELRDQIALDCEAGRAALAQLPKGRDAWI